MLIYYRSENTLKKVQRGAGGLLAFLNMAIFEKLFPELSDLFSTDKSNNASF